MTPLIRNAFVVVSLGAPALMTGIASQPAPAPGKSAFHHVHLNSVNPAAAVEFYSKAYPASTAKAAFNGSDAVKVDRAYLLFTKVAAPPPTAPQSALWHFGWFMPDVGKHTDYLRSLGVELAQMWDAADGKLVDLSSDGMPGTRTQEEILAMRAARTVPTGRGGFGFVRGPDRALIENAQSGSVERFNHVHLYHEHPLCAMQWYVAHLGASQALGRGTPPPPAGADCKQLYAAPTYPSLAKTGFAREPLSRVEFGDVALAIHAWPGGGLVSSRGQVVDHWAVQVTDLDTTVMRLKRDGIKFLQDIQPWGTMRAATIEGPDRIAIEIVGAK